MSRFLRLCTKPCVLVVALAATTSACAAQSPRVDSAGGRVPGFEIFVHQPGYRGPFIAIYDQTGGVAPEWRGDTGIYQVPSDGVLRIAHPEPPRSTKAVHVFANAPHTWIGSYPTCADMRVHVLDGEPRVCWLDFSVGGTGMPDHIVAVVTDWGGIPVNFHRTTVLYDSVVYKAAGRRGSIVREWEEPPDLGQRGPPTRVQ